MSRIDNLGEILEWYEGRRPKPDYLPSEEDIKKMHLSLMRNIRHTMFYIGCEKDKYNALFCCHEERPKPISEEAMQATLDCLHANDLDFAGILFYSEDMHPVEYVKKKNPRKCVPDKVELPDLMIIMDNRGKYLMFKGNEMIDNFDGMTGS